MGDIDRGFVEGDGKIGLALSGGGCRAMAFHLGCLRAIRDAGLLDRLSTISSVSGGSFLAALYCASSGSFEEFEAKTRKLLAKGLTRAALKVAVTSTEGARALFYAIVLAVDRGLAFAVRGILRLLGLRRYFQIAWLAESPIPRRASRTTIFRRVLAEVFEHKMLPELRRDRPKLIIVACELGSKSAFYFASDHVGSWRLGSAAPEEIEIAHAVSASAAYPLLLPALDETLIFSKSGVSRKCRVVLTDGGVYDNLALAPLWPGRDPKISLLVDEYPRIIACRAGYATKHSPAPTFLLARMSEVFECLHARSQNLAMNRLFDLQRGGEIEAFLLPYLDQDDELLASPPPNLVTADQVADYPTDFSAMPEEWIEKLVKRGEQLTKALLGQYWPEGE